MVEKPPSRSRLKQVRLLLWSLIALTLLATAALYFVRKTPRAEPRASSGPLRLTLGGPFTLVDGNGKPFSSNALAGKPYALYFGFTRCGDACPTTLSRLVKLRREAGKDEQMQILFVTIDPQHDHPSDVGQYASLFNAPIIGLTGTQAQIDEVKRNYGIYAEPVANAPMGKEMQHTATVLLFDRHGNFAATISPAESDADARSKIQKLLT